MRGLLKNWNESIPLLVGSYCVLDNFPYTEMTQRRPVGGKGIEADGPKQAIILFTGVCQVPSERRKTCWEGCIEGRPHRKGEGRSLEKPPKVEREAFRVSFYYIGLELIF